MEDAVANIKQGNIHPLGVDRRVTVLQRNTLSVAEQYNVTLKHVRVTIVAVEKQ